MNNDFPPRFIERLESLIADPNERNLFLDKCTEPLPKVVRFSPNTKVPDAWTLKPTSIPEAFFIERANQSEVPLGKTLEHFTGQIYVQSLSSMLPVVALNPQPGEKILDLCAAPGSKTTFLSQKMGKSGVIVANEPSGSRSKKLSHNLDRLGVSNSVMIQSDGTLLHRYFGQEFDRVLLDAPCSSEGFGRKDSSFFKKMWSEKKIFQASKLQKKLILSGYEILAPGGIMVYSTCTSAVEENEDIIEFLKSKYPEAELLDIDLPNVPTTPGINGFDKTIRIYPHQETDLWTSESFFVAKIQKPHAIKRLPPHKPLIKNTPQVLKKNRAAEISVRMAKAYGLPKSWAQEAMNKESKATFVEKDGDLYLTTREVTQFFQKNLYRKFGLKVMDKDGNLSHDFCVHFGVKMNKNILEITNEEQAKWLQGYDLKLPENSSFSESQVIIKFQGFSLGCGKIVSDKVKNKVPRELLF